MTERTITLEIQPDNIPEDDEVSCTEDVDIFEVTHVIIGVFCNAK